MNTEPSIQIIHRLTEGGLDEKFAKIILALVGQPPLVVKSVTCINIKNGCV